MLLASLVVDSIEDTILRDGHLSLREAISVVNGDLSLSALDTGEFAQIVGNPTDPDPDSIVFRISGDGVHIISPATALPVITRPVEIDGYSQPGSAPGSALSPADPRIELTGILAPGGTNGLDVQAAGTLIRGLVINNFAARKGELNGFGIVLGGAGGNQVQGCFIGTDSKGTSSHANTGGIGLFSPANTIGGDMIADRNIISGNSYNGIQVGGLRDGQVTDASRCKIYGNYIGTDLSGTHPLGNDNGIRFHDGGGACTVGGSLADQGNLISGNRFQGVLIDTGSPGGNVLINNRIGTTFDGTLSLANGAEGVEIAAPNNFVGLPLPRSGNLISGNSSTGVFLVGQDATGNVVAGNRIGTDVTGSKALGNGLFGVEAWDAPANHIDENLISSNASAGVSILGMGATGNRVRGNRIGTDADGTSDLGNGESGIDIQGASDNWVGDTQPLPDGTSPRNIISGNDIDGVFLHGGAHHNHLIDNFIGVDVAGRLQVPATASQVANSFDGVLIAAAHDNELIGNLISGNGRDGIAIVGEGSDGNLIKGRNRIGVNDSGTVKIPNEGHGILIDNGAGNLIMCDSLGEGNIIAGNKGDGVRISGSKATGNILTGNFIGTDYLSLGPLANERCGVFIDGAPGNTIGEEGEPANVISSNAQHGIWIRNASDTVIQANLVGTDMNGSRALGNGQIGVYLDHVVSTLVGGRTWTRGNIISGHKTQGGVLVEGGKGNEVSGNGIGTDASRDKAIGTQGYGVKVNGAEATTIGSEWISNVITGNEVGIRIENKARTTTIKNNSVGAGADGEHRRSNTGNGIEVEDAQAVIIDGDVVSGNGHHGILVSGGTTSQVLVQDCYIGTSISGANGLGNDQTGIVIAGVSGCQIGPYPGGLRNVISGNKYYGIWVTGQNAATNVITNCFIGTAPDGTAPLGNGLYGIFLDEARDTTVGGTTRQEGNVISANTDPQTGSDHAGVYISGGGGNRVLSNRIGTDDKGVKKVGHQDYGVWIEDSPGNRIGDGPVGNVISGNEKGGVRITGGASKGNIVQSNTIGLQEDLRSPQGNGTSSQSGDGIRIVNAPGTTIGGTSGQGNVISGNTGDGIHLEGTGSLGTVIRANIIGTDFDVTSKVGNANGVLIDNAVNTVVGDDKVGNIISGNNKNGVKIEGAGSRGNSVQRNRIGTNKNGDLPLGNLEDGVYLDNVEGNLIGGAGGAGNLISDNIDGVVISGGRRNYVVYNGIGTDANRVKSLGIQMVGVRILGSTDNEVWKNTISGNQAFGVEISGGAAKANLIGENQIGTQGDGTSPLPNKFDGVYITDNASNNLIGLKYDRGNTIGFNGGAGVEVVSGVGNRIRFNSISDNIGLGIDLGADGVTPNDPGDIDTGPNDRMNFPILSSVSIRGEVMGYLRAKPGAAYIVDIYGASQDPSGYGEGSDYMGSTSGTTDASGLGQFVARFPNWNVPQGARVTATATEVQTGSTSEFSLAVQAQADRDDDGASDAEEDRAPNNGDANNDGIPDRDEPGVASLFDDISGGIASVIAAAGLVLKSVSVQAQPPGAVGPPPGAAQPYGNFNFLVEGLVPGASTVVRLLLPPGPAVNTYYQYGPTLSNRSPHWYDFLYDGTTGAEFVPGAILLHFVDGLRGDHDLSTNGVIADPGGPAYAITPGLHLSADSVSTGIVAGQPITAYLSVTNTAQLDATDVVITNVLPVNARFVSASVPAGAAVNEEGGLVSVRIGTVAAGSSIEIAVTAVTMHSGAFLQQAHVAGTLAVDDPTDNDVTITTAVAPLPALLVNAVDDTDDGINDGVHTTLREAIRLANAMPGAQQINFAIPGAGPFVIRPSSPLPAITDPVVIDATSQPGYGGAPVVLLDGRGTGPASGLVIDTSSTRVRGLAIGGFATDGGLDTGNGIFIASGTENSVEACYLGTDTSGTIALANSGAGVLLKGGWNNTLGGTVAGAGNLISGNQYWGVLIGRDFGGDTVAGNRIGTTADGLSALGNGGPGVEIASGDNRVAHNVISANDSGVVIRSADANAVQGNLIGLAADGSTPLGNSSTGVMILYGATNIIGGTAAGEGNTISGNAGAGIAITEAGWVAGVGNQVLGNFIGTAADGTTAAGNGGSGVVVGFSGSGNAIGGIGAGQANVIAFNGRDGVSIDTTSTGTAVRGNAIHDNVRLGIDLGGDGVTPNDPADLDIVVSTGINPVLNFPVLTSASSGSLGTLVRGTVDGPTVDTPFWGITSGQLTLDFYASPTADPSGNGEGRLYLGSTTVVNRGTMAFTADLTGVAPAGWVVTATATDRNGNSSEFSAPITAELDSDHDGVLDSVEDGAPGVGDGNADGIPDRIQACVASLPSAVDGAYVTLVTESSGILRDVRALADPSPADRVSGVTFPVGLFELRIPLGGGTVTVLTPSGVTTDTVYGYGAEAFRPADHWYQFRYDGLFGAEIVAGHAVVHLADGQFGDHDLSRNSEVLARFGPATISAGAGSVLVVTTTSDTGPGSLRAAVDAANLLPGRDVITFAVPATDPGHVYYRDDGVPGQVSADAVAVTAASSDADIADIDPDHPYSWWRIQPSLSANPIHSSLTRIGVPWLTDSVIIDATTQPGWQPATAMTPAVLRIELEGTPAGPRVDGLRLVSGGCLVRGLSIHGFRNDGWYGGSQIIIGNEWGYRIAGGNNIEGNHLGTDISGTLADAAMGDYIVPRYGVLIATSDDNVIGGETPAARNVISGLRYGGINIFEDVDGNVILGNFIGTDATGTRAVPNQGGIRIQGGNVLIGGDRPEARNVISGNMGYGVNIVSEGGALTGNRVQGNFIGTDLTGTAALPNTQGGVALVGSTLALVGGSAPGEGNLISGNDGPGVRVTAGEIAYGTNSIQGNLIGTDVTGTRPLGNAGDGIWIGQTTENMVGSTEPGAGNVIAHNGGTGILVGDGTRLYYPTFSNALEGNRIFDNGALGIDLEGDGVTQNDPGGGRVIVEPRVVSAGVTQTGTLYDVHGTVEAAPSSAVTVQIKVFEFEGEFPVEVVTDGSGLAGFSLVWDGVPVTLEGVRGEYPVQLNWANLHRTFPLITSVVTGADTTISGTLDSIASATFHVEFFASTTADLSGHGEGETLLGTAEVSTDANGQAAFTVTFPTPVPYGHVVTATATDTDGNTSEFSSAFTVTPPDSQIDFGSAPDPAYPTLLAHDGARHVIVPGIRLGKIVVAEADGQAAVDNDGVSFLAPLVPGESAVIRVNSSCPARLDAWFDWNADGDWTEDDEVVFVGESLSTGDNTLFVTVPSTATIIDRTYARFRLSTAGGLAPTGLADDGEVEDYAIAVVGTSQTNIPPVAADDSAKTAINTLLVLDVTANDFDPDGDLDPRSVRILTAPQHGSATVESATGLVTYSPDSGFMGIDAIAYDIADTKGLRARATITVVVGVPNASPLARDDTATTDQGRPALVAVLSNDTDPDGDALSVVSVDTAGAHGVVEIDPSGVLVYTPMPDFRGSDVFLYTINDVHGATASASVTVVVSPVNQPPRATDDSVSTPEGRAKWIDVAANDSDPDGNLDARSVSLSFAPLHGNAAVDPSTGLVRYTPAEGFAGTDAFGYEIADTQGLRGAASVTVEVTPNGHKPVAVPDSARTPEGVPVTMPVLANDTDAGGDLEVGSVRVVQPPVHGWAEADPSTGVITYAPITGFRGIDRLIYEVRDAEGNSASSTVDITVDPIPSPPSAADDRATTGPRTPVLIDLLANDAAIDSPLVAGTVRIVAGPARGFVAINPTDGKATYTPPAGFSGPVRFAYEVADETGATTSATVLVSVDAGAPNTAPVAFDDAYTTFEATPLAVSAPGLLANDSDVDGDSLTLIPGSAPRHGLLTAGADGSFRYEPEVGFFGQDTFTYRVSDGQTASDFATATVTVSERSVLSFGSATYRALESEGQCAITVIRTGGSSTPVSARVWTQGGTATAGVDYQSVNSVISFMPGQMSCIFVIPLMENRVVQGDRTIGLRLGDSTAGATLGVPDAATLSIIDDDVTPPIVNGPQVVTVQRLGIHWQPTSILVAFDTAIDPTRAIDVRNYRLVLPGRDGRLGTRDDQFVRIASATYNPLRHWVTLHPARRLNFHNVVYLGVNGTTSLAVTDASGNILDGDTNGRPGGTFVTTLLGYGSHTLWRRHAPAGPRAIAARWFSAAVRRSQAPIVKIAANPRKPVLRAG